MLYLTIIGGAFIAWLILAVLFMPPTVDADLAKSREITLDAWRSRPLWEKLIGAVA